MIDPDLTTVGGPSAAYGQLLTSAKLAMNEVARRRSAELPGLLEHLQDDVVLTSHGTNESALGWFQCGAWQHDGRSVDEIFLNADRRHGHGEDAAEDVLTTLIHEMAHAWNSMNGIQDCSNRGRYHSKRFAEIAVQLGLSVTKHHTWGHATPGLQDRARQEYGDLLAALDDAVVITREPGQVTDTKGTSTATATNPTPVLTDEADAKYVFASCQCRTSRGTNVAFRMARGSWREDVPVWCSACGTAFERRVSTASGQSEGGATTA